MKQSIINKIAKQKITTLVIMALILAYIAFYILEYMNFDKTPIHIYNIYVASHTGVTAFTILLVIKHYSEDKIS